MKQSKTSTKARSRRQAGSWSPVAGKQDLPDPSKPVPQEPSSASREQVREVAPPVTAARESKRPMERSKQRRSRRS